MDCQYQFSQKIVKAQWANIYLFKVSNIMLEQRPDGRCSNVILLTLNMYMATGWLDNHYKIAQSQKNNHKTFLKSFTFMQRCLWQMRMLAQILSRMCSRVLNLYTA